MRAARFQPPHTAILFAVVAHLVGRFVSRTCFFLCVRRARSGKLANISRKSNMKKTKDVSDEDEYSADDPEEMEGASEEEWTPEAGAEVSPRYSYFRPLFFSPKQLSLLLHRLESSAPLLQSCVKSHRPRSRLYAIVRGQSSLSVEIPPLRIPCVSSANRNA